MKTTVKWFVLLVFVLLIYGQTEGTDPCVDVNIEQETAVVGRDVILPCFPKLPINAADDILEWKKNESDIYIIRDGKASGPYKDRASVPFEEFKKGNASLKLFHVMESDKGKHCCCINRHNVRECTAVNLDISEEGEEKKEGRKDKKDSKWVQTQTTETPQDPSSPPTCAADTTNCKDPDVAQTLTTEMPLYSTIPPTAGPGDTTNDIGLIIGLSLVLILGILAAGVGHIFYKRRHQILNFIQRVRYQVSPTKEPPS